MIRKALIIAALVMVILCMGCQATPEKPVIVQKDLEQMIEKGTLGSETPSPEPDASKAPEMDNAALCAHYGVPERFQKTITEGNLTINCDVAIELPDTLKLPMARVEAGRFSQEQVYALFNALCADTPMYVWPEIQDKAYYEQEILDCQANMAKETDKETIKFFKKMLKDLQEQYEKAPESIELTPCDGTMIGHEFEIKENGVLAGTTMLLSATSDPHAREDSTTIYVQNDADYTEANTFSWVDEEGNTQVVAPRSGSWFEFQRRGYDTSRTKYCQNGTKLADVTALSLSGGKAKNCLLGTTPKQARDIVEGLQKKVGIDDMMIDTVCLYSSKSDMPPEFIAHLKEEGRYVEEKPETHAYAFRLLRNLNGVKTESTQGSSETSTDGMSFGAEWYYEELTITVDDQGIANVYWMGPLEVKETITDDTAILPFSDIEEIFEKMMVINSSIYVDPERKEQIDITHVCLSLQRVMEQDSYTTGLLVPVWNFYGSITSWSDDGEKRTTDMGLTPFVSINAIDGSVIDTQKGY